MRLAGQRFNTISLVIILLSLAIAPAAFLGEDNRNILLIGIMFISPFIVFRYSRLTILDIWLLIFMASIALCPLIFHPEKMRWSTVLYSIMFCYTFMAYERLLIRESIDVKYYLSLIKYLIYAYFIVLIIQQLCVVFGVTIFNVNNYNQTEPWKLNSLATEPSQAARIVALLMYVFLTVKEIVSGEDYSFKVNFYEDRLVWLSFVWTMGTMGSAAAIFFLAIVIAKVINLKNIIFVLILSSLIILVITNIESTATDRTINIFKATLTLNEDKIIEADHSSSLRIVPVIICAKMININTIDSWFGHGIDFVSSFMYKKLPGVPKGISGGGMLQFWLEYGFFPFLVFISFSLFYCIKKGDFLSIIFWFLLVFMYGINSQIVWLCIILLFTNKYYSNLINKEKYVNS